MSMTQEVFNEACDMLKSEFDKEFENSNQSTVTMAMMIGTTKDAMIRIATFYELDVKPAAESEGLVVKSLEGLLGVKMTITAK